MITQFGSCRVAELEFPCMVSGLAQWIGYTHSTAETLQMIRFIKGDLIIPHPYNRYCFRTAILSTDVEYRLNPQPRYISWSSDFKNLFDITDRFVVEVSSMKTYKSGGYYLHNLAVDKRDRFWKYTDHKEIFDDLTIGLQSVDEIEYDLLEIRDALDKPMLVVSHFDATKDGLCLDKRHQLVEILGYVCGRHNIKFYNPTSVLKDYKQSEIINDDLTHYTSLGFKLISKNVYENCISD